MKRGLSVAAVLAALVPALGSAARSGAVASHAGHRQEAIWVMGCYGGREEWVRPTSLQFDCPEEGAQRYHALPDLHWHNWGHAVTTATGSVEVCLLNPRQATPPPHWAWQECQATYETPAERATRWILEEPIEWRLSHPVRCTALKPHTKPRTRLYYGVTSFIWGEPGWRKWNGWTINGIYPDPYTLRCPEI